MAVVKLFIRDSTALCRKQTRVNAVPISLEAPTNLRRDKIDVTNYIDFDFEFDFDFYIVLFDFQILFFLYA